MDQFNLVDKVIRLGDDDIVTSRSLTLAEDYLADHFPGFPVMPGVLMLEAMVQAGAWLVRNKTDFSLSMVHMVDARNVKYASFLQPGDTLRVTATLRKQEGDTWHFKGEGVRDGQAVVSGRFVLRAYNLADTEPKLAGSDAYMVKKLKERWAVIGKGL